MILINRSKNIRIYVTIVIVLGVLTLALEFFTRSHGSFLLAQNFPVVAYLFSMLCALTTILVVFYAIRQRSWGVTLRLFLLAVAAMLSLLDYYIFYDTNMLACLPILALASLFVMIREWPK